MMSAPLYLGCDPEVFLQDAAGAYISAIGKIGGSKADPRQLPLGNGYAVQEDNVALEFNIPPADSKNGFIESIQLVRKYLENSVNEMGLKFSTESATIFPEDQLNNPAALMFGCDPDYNAWTMKRNPKPISPDWRLRSAGGHVHVGYHMATNREKVTLIRLMDLFLGIPSLFMDNGSLRKSLYGKAGAFRPKPYGVEYRTLSNYWIFDPELIDWVWRSTERAIDTFERDSIPIDNFSNGIQEAINNNNMDVAQSLVDHFGLEVLPSHA
jgi:hypothetical protein